MDRWLLSFFLGAILSLLLPAVPALFYETLLIITLLLFFSVSKWRSKLAFILGSLWMLFQGHTYYQSLSQWHDDSSAFYYRPHQIEAKIANIPKRDGNKLRFNALVTQLDQQALSQPLKLRLVWEFAEQDERNVSSQQSSVDNSNIIQGNLFQGNIVALTVKIKPAHGYANSGGFNYQRWLKTHNIVATGYVLADKPPKLISGDTTLRQAWFNRLQPLTTDFSLAPIFNALTFGERNEFSPVMWQVLKQTGTQHLVAISGLHVGLIFFGSLLLLRLLLFSLPLGLLSASARQKLMQYDATNTLLILSLLVACFYSYLADFSTPTVRALIMLTLYVGARLLAIQLSLSRLLLLTLASITLLMPFSLFSESFWLSFIAVCLIFIIAWRFKHLMWHQNFVVRYVKSLLVIQLGLSLLLLPITAFSFNQLALSGLLANLLALPVMSLVIIPLSLAALVISLVSNDVAQALLGVANYVLEPLWNYLTWLGERFQQLFGTSQTTTELVNIIILVSVLTIGVKIFILPKRALRGFCKRLTTYRGEAGKLYTKLSAMALILLVVVSLSASKLSASLAQDKPGASVNWKVHVLDVGQGLAIVVEQNNRVLIYDTGARYRTLSNGEDNNDSIREFNLAERVIVPYLQAKGLTQVDYIIVSHDDNDHAGGLGYLLTQYPSASLIYNQELATEFITETPLELANIVQSECLAGRILTWQDLTLTFLSPNVQQADDNDDSCVVHISGGDQGILLTGDISTKIEQRIVTEHPALNVDALIAPHHGSKTSSSHSFINALAPKVAVFSSGFLNRWHMPHATVVSRYQHAGVELFNTAEHGMITLKFNATGLDVVSYRQDIYPYWFAN